ncbi:MAG: HEAT repeat domain-containing protein [Kiritimatiellae bacterium]|nr:HEAT repeat domain-containing protein [Kiritimatiellia bacterium]
MNPRLSILSMGMGWVLLAGTFCAAEAPVCVGLFKDSRSGPLEGVEETLRQEGMEPKIIGQKDIQSLDGVKDLDVIYFPGGWYGDAFPTKDRHRVIADFVAQGKGVLAEMFRGGPVRTGTRPMFPEVATTWNRVNGSYVLAKGHHPVLKGLAAPACFKGYDHMVLKPGKAGEVFLVDVDGLPAGVSGEVFSGRYIALGVSLGDKEPMEGNQRVLFLNCIRWLAGAKRLEGDALERSRQKAELSFLRQQKITDYTLDDRGPDRAPGIIPGVVDVLTMPLEGGAYRLENQAMWLHGTGKRAAEEAQALLLRCAEQLDQAGRAEIAARVSRINEMDRESLRGDDPEKYQSELTKRLAAMRDCQAGLDRAMNLANDLQAKVDTAKTQARQAERETDAALVPDLLNQCKSEVVAARRRATLELGRIGDKRAIPVLIERIQDADEEVRRNAIQGLGWMQAAQAVPALSKAALSEDKWLRRRAVQALGQIGDKRAVPVLLPLIRHADFSTAENAILALGWLGDTQAVQPLLDLLKELDAGNNEGKDRMCSVIRALGHIGDKRAVPVLEEFVKTADDFPGERRGGKRLANIYLTHQGLGLEGYSHFALEEIAKNGRPRAGIEQMECLALKEYFYRIHERFNFFGGRPYMAWAHWAGSPFTSNPDLLLDYMWSAGATGFIGGGGILRFEPAALKTLLRDMDSRGLCMISDLPYIGLGQPPPDARTGGDSRAKPLRELPNYIGLVHKAGYERDIFFCEDLPALAGFWSEETYPQFAMDGPYFEALLRDKYGPDFRRKLGLTGNEPIVVPVRNKRFEHPRLWAEYLDAAGQMVIDDFREEQEWLHGLRKGFAYTFNVSAPGGYSAYIGVCPRAGAVMDAHGPESYASCGKDNAFMMDLARDGETRPVLCEFYNWYTPSLAHAERGFATHLVHGESFFNFTIGHIFKQAPREALWTWEKGRWDKARQTFRKARELSEYLAPARSAANVALIYSDRTSAILYDGGVVGAPERRYYQHQSALWDALDQSHIPLDTIWAETLTAEKLARYKALILSDAKSLDPREIALLRQWVKDGGVLLASGATTLFNQWGEAEKNYQLADVFGVAYEGAAAEKNPAKSDSYCFVNSSMSCVKIVDEGLVPTNFVRYVRREIKPEKSIEMFTIRNVPFEVPGVKHGMACEYDRTLGYDRVMPDTAKVWATWANGDPALTVNDYGQGRCIFLTAAYPALSHTTSDWEMFPNSRIFWPGMRELLAGLVLGGMKAAGSSLPVEAAGLPGQVEVTVKSQPEQRRWLIHLLNFDPKLEKVSSGTMTVRPPAMEKLKVTYPDNGQDVPFKQEGQVVTFETRAFGVHDMVVVQY